MSNNSFTVTNILSNEIFKNVTFIWNRKRKVFFIAQEILNVLEYGDRKYRKELLKKIIPDSREYKFTLGEAKIFGIFGIENVVPKGYKHPDTIILTKPALHLLLSRSRKKLARDLNNWIFLEVIPSIEKNGYYIDYSQNKFERHQDEKEEEIKILRDENKFLKERVEKLRLDLESKRKHPIIDEIIDYEDKNYSLERDAIDYRIDIEDLKEENKDLKKERENLERKVINLNEEVRNLSKENKKLKETINLIKDGISKL